MCTPGTKGPKRDRKKMQRDNWAEQAAGMDWPIIFHTCMFFRKQIQALTCRSNGWAARHSSLFIDLILIGQVVRIDKSHARTHAWPIRTSTPCFPVGSCLQLPINLFPAIAISGILHLQMMHISSMLSTRCVYVADWTGVGKCGQLAGQCRNEWIMPRKLTHFSHFVSVS